MTVQIGARYGVSAVTTGAAAGYVDWISGAIGRKGRDDFMLARYKMSTTRWTRRFIQTRPQKCREFAR